MLRVALVITELDVGGAERQLVQLATGMDRRFFKPHIYALGPPPRPGGDELVRQAEAADVKVEFLHAKKWWQFGPTVEKLAARLREFQPKIMQSFLFHANVIGSTAARQAGVPHVCLGMRVNDPSWWRAMVERRVARRADRVVCVSSAVADAVGRRLHLQTPQLMVIRNGVDVDRFEFAPPADLTPFGVPPGVRPLIFIGRLDQQKGADRLQQLALHLEPLNQHLLIVGRGKLEQQLRARLTSKRVHFAGWQADIAPLLAASSLLLLPSRYEGMPNALLEAMAAGLPVLATPVEGVTEILSDPQQVMPFAPLVWSAAITQLVQSAEHRAQVGVGNRQRVREHFSIEKMVTAYERLYSGLAGTTRPN